MKTLYLLRHAKSSWKDPGLDDLDRPLNKRGRETAKTMAAYLRRANANAGLAGNHGTHPLVGMDAALHQGVGFSLLYQLDRFSGRVVTVRRLLDRKVGYVGFR